MIGKWGRDSVAKKSVHKLLAMVGQGWKMGLKGRVYSVCWEARG